MKIGFIGAGNMAGALIHGVVNKQVARAGDVSIFDVDAQKMEALKCELDVAPARDTGALIGASDIVVLAVKPNVLEGVLTAHGALLSGKAVISIVTGYTVEKLRALLPEDTRLLRVMPNTPALCGQGMTAFAKEHTLAPAEVDFAVSMFEALGRLTWVPEHLIEAVIGVSGSGPAYAYLFIEAMADGGVACGLPRAQAMEMAAQTLKGAAEMVLTTGTHPGALKDAVCSPGGTTIEAVRTLENKGLRAAVMEAVLTACEKGREMSRA